MPLQQQEQCPPIESDNFGMEFMLGNGATADGTIVGIQEQHSSNSVEPNVSSFNGFVHHIFALILWKYLIGSKNTNKNDEKFKAL